ncbi:cell envelope biogenesis protein OmpA [Marivirga tractuosa]|uniref:OmpA/MotB domain protein n=1 Tax=Marivirga tractuosa (strain ATCC 23168 / DSM 4126 / NBRC 15989 / NCIMB 1408 / VKM B-1430 / H-43) TaxID=643867 RepID=E4TSD8_MARTH|nr:OmpA family protein [Marivirga tractuosa]ADR22855.1 OmpA/MotB domain protein [Marivirga tractuosa DSM 4126]BDD16473.1 cell envelope biogenesis protein OmpA [Marivirga tractuosa]
MNFKIIPLLIITVFYTLTLSSQDYKWRTERLVEKSKEALYKRDWEAAVQYMEDAIEIEPENHHLYLEKASLFYGINDLNKVVSSLEKAFSLEENWPSKYTDYYFILGKESFDRGKYQLAKKPIEIYKQKGYKEEYLKMAHIISESIDFALQEIDKHDGSDKNVESIESDKIFRSIYFPFFTLYPSEFLYFTGQRTGSLAEGIYRAKLSGSQFQNVEKVPVINTKDNEGAAAISADGRVMVFTGCNKRDGLGSCDLYISYFEGDEWQEPENLGGNINSSAWESQPFLSSDGRFLIFSSNRTGGFGKRDLYYSKKVNGKWTEAINLGKKINTFADEISPFLTLSNDEMYFSSNGGVGMGGFDIYKIKWPLDEGEVSNLGLPVNSFNNELSYHQKFSGEKYWSREMQSEAQYPPSKIFFQKSKVENEVNLVFGGVINSKDSSKLRAKIQIYDLKLDSLIQETYSNRTSGEYKVIIPRPSEYAFYVDAPNYLFNSRRLEISESKTELNFALKPIEKGAIVELNNIYFEFDSYELSEKSSNEINKVADLLSQNPNLKIEIGGYTDEIGSASYNKELSRKRAKAVYEKLIIKDGVLEENIKAVGYGAKKLPSGEYRKTVIFKVL